MNSIILNIADSVDIGTLYNQLRMLDPNVRIAKTNIDIEKAEDEYLLALALERKKNDNGKKYTQEEILAERGLTIEDIDRMLEAEDVGLEYELSG